MKLTRSNRALQFLLCFVLLAALLCLPAVADDLLGEAGDLLGGMPEEFGGISSLIMDIHSIADANILLSTLEPTVLILMAAVALVFALAGYNLFRIAIFAGGFGGGWILSTFVYDWFLSLGVVDPSEIEEYVPFIVYALGSLLLAGLAFKILKVGIFAASAAATYFFLQGFPLLNGLVDMIYAEDNDIKYLIARILIALLVGVLALYLTRPVMIVTTAAAGGMVAGLSIMVLLGQTENEMVELLVALAIVALGLSVQFHKKRRD